MFSLLCGYLPFDNIEDFEQNYYEHHFMTPEWENVSIYARDLIDHLLEEDYGHRFSAKDAMRHPWIVQNSPPPELDSDS